MRWPSRLRCSSRSSAASAAITAYWRWPGSFAVVGSTLRPMALAEVRRPAETLQFTDGFTGRNNCYPLRGHRNLVTLR